jgi:hypothetical protein
MRSVAGIFVLASSLALWEPCTSASENGFASAYRPSQPSSPLSQIFFS